MNTRIGGLLDRSRIHGRERGERIEQPDLSELVREIPLTQIDPNPEQQRRYFAEEPLQRLAASVAEQGVLQPILLRPQGQRYQIVFGERRWRAAQLAGLHTIPAQIREMSDMEAALNGAIENLQRSDINRFEDVNYKLLLLEMEFEQGREAVIAMLYRIYNNSADHLDEVHRVAAVFDLVGTESWQSFVANGLPVLKLPPLLLEALQVGRVEYTKAVLIKRAPEAEHQRLLQLAVNGMTVGELRAELTQLSANEQTEQARERHQLKSVQKRLTARRLKKMSPEHRRSVMVLLDSLDKLLLQVEQQEAQEKDERGSEDEAHGQAAGSPTVVATGASGT